MKNEFKVGDIIILQVIKVESEEYKCKDCFFYDIGCTDSPCSKSQRIDNNSVIFRLVKLAKEIKK